MMKYDEEKQTVRVALNRRTCGAHLPERWLKMARITQASQNSNKGEPFPWIKHSNTTTRQRRTTRQTPSTPTSANYTPSFSHTCPRTPTSWISAAARAVTANISSKKDTASYP